jgi:hypothetical protein
MTASKIAAVLDGRREGRGSRSQRLMHGGGSLVGSGRERLPLIRHRNADGAAGIRPSDWYNVYVPIERTLDALRWGSA